MPMWRTWLALIALIATVHAADAQQQPRWIADPNGCPVWDSTPTPGESITWSGACKNGLASGSGTLVWFLNGRPNETYNGVLTDGHYTGRGKQVWPSGASYEGDYLNDRANGHGTYRTSTGEVFTGNWVKGCLMGGNRRLAVGIPLSDCP